MMFDEEMEEESEDGDGLVEYIEDFNDKEKLEEDMQETGYSNVGSSEKESVADEDDKDDDDDDESIDD